MDRRTLNTLIVNDDDLDCHKEDYTLDDIDITKLGFVPSAVEKFDCIVYNGKLGKKVIRIRV